MIMWIEIRMTKYEVRLMEIVNAYLVSLTLYFDKDMAYPARLVLLHS
jgi:hypothetical protein